MGYGHRSVEACVRAMEKGIVSESHFRAIMKCHSVNVQPLAQFLQSRVPMVRTIAAKVVAALGDVSPVLDAALVENDRGVLTEMLKALGERGEGLEALEGMVCSSSIIREEVIRMYRRAGRVDTLFPLLFNKDDHLVSRIKRYVNEQERKESRDS